MRLGGEGERRESGKPSFLGFGMGASHARRDSGRTGQAMFSDFPLALKTKPLPRGCKLISGLV